MQVGELRRAVADAVLNNRPFARALADASPTARTELERRSAAFPGDVPFDPALVRKVPPGFCAQLLVVPVRTDPRTGTVEAAAVDPRDPHLAAGASVHVDAPVKPAGRAARGDREPDCGADRATAHRGDAGAASACSWSTKKT
ncbi:MAG: hypothetical protein IPJ34_43475 [Myxococcales bacterium]|nr:hypothetical protein [Myxococcales bacterium]